MVTSNKRAHYSLKSVSDRPCEELLHKVFATIWGHLESRGIVCLICQVWYFICRRWKGKGWLEGYFMYLYV